MYHMCDKDLKKLIIYVYIFSALRLTLDTDSVLLPTMIWDRVPTVSLRNRSRLNKQVRQLLLLISSPSDME